jgi:hypothetical protein
MSGKPITENNEVSNNLIQNSVEPQSLQSLSNHNGPYDFPFIKVKERR